MSQKEGTGVTKKTKKIATWTNATCKAGAGWTFIYNQEYRRSDNDLPTVKLSMTFRGSGRVAVSLDAYTLPDETGKRDYKNISTWTIDMSQHQAINNSFSGDQLSVMDEMYCQVGVSFRGAVNSCTGDILSDGKLIVEY